MSKKRPDSICQHCGKSYHPKTADRTTYCSRECYFASGKIGRWKLKKETTQKVWYCKICNKPMDTYHVYCSDECRKIKANKYSLELNKVKMIHKTTKVRLCKECNKPFVSEYGNKRRTFCSIECSDRYADRCKCRNAKKRAKKHGCEYEYINPLRVFVRDGWRCQLCGKQLNKKDRGTIKDNAPELDHIIPISKGGGHLYINTQCACRKCNSDKGNQERGQIRLFS